MRISDWSSDVCSSDLRAEECMSAIDPRADRVGHSNTVLRALGQIRNDLEYRPISEILSELPQHMQRVQKVTREASEAIRSRFFPTQAEPSWRSEEHTSELQSLMRISYAVFCLKKKKNKTTELYKETNTRPT